MAGGPEAQIAPCPECTGASDRTYDGLETDWYRCRQCGVEFGICFDPDMGGGGPPTQPLYPPSRRNAEAIRNLSWRKKRRREM